MTGILWLVYMHDFIPKQPCTDLSSQVWDNKEVSRPTGFLTSSPKHTERFPQDFIPISDKEPSGIMETNECQKQIKPCIHACIPCNFIAMVINKQQAVSPVLQQLSKDELLSLVSEQLI